MDPLGFRSSPQKNGSAVFGGRIFFCFVPTERKPPRFSGTLREIGRGLEEQRSPFGRDLDPLIPTEEKNAETVEPKTFWFSKKTWSILRRYKFLYVDMFSTCSDMR